MNSTIYVPVAPSSNDKLLYIVEYSDFMIRDHITNVYVQDILIERFRTTYTIPFAVHFNSKISNRYIAARILAPLLPANALFIKVTVDCTQPFFQWYWNS